MKAHLLAIFTLLTALCGAQAAENALGPDVAVMLIKIPGQKQPVQVVLGLYDQAAPLTTGNFKILCGKKFYNGMRFNRVFPSSLVQTGDPYSKRGDIDKSGTGGPGYTVPAEIGRRHVRGSIAASRLPDNINPAKASNGSQFYVCLAPMPKLDGKYTFGEVLEGLDILDAISNQPTDSNDFPLAKIIIKSITIQPRFADSARQ